MIAMETTGQEHTIMKIHFYGTGASEAVPATFCKRRNCEKIRRLGGRDFRSRTCTRIDENLLVDFSADIFDHMRYGGLDMNDIDYLIVTHAHMDHFYPEELLHIAPPYSMSPTPGKLKVFGNESVCAKLKALGADKISDYLEVCRISDFEEISAGDFSVKALPANHDPSQECHLYLIRKNGKNLLYAHDTGYFKEETWEALKKEHLDGAVLDCTCCNGPTYFQNHMGFEDNLRVKKRMMELGIADQGTVFVATHFVHTYGPFQDELEPAFKAHGFLAAYDGMDVTV